MGRYRRRLRAGILVGAIVLAAAACGDDDGGSAGEGSSPEGSTAAEPEAPGDPTETPGSAAAGDSVADSELDLDATIRISYAVGPSRWDAHRASSSFDNTSLFLTYDRLVHITPDVEPIPGLATDWKFADDASYLEMNLRKGVTFHDGEPFNAQAVKANVERAKTVENSAVASELEVVDRVEVVDDDTVRFMLNGPAASLPLTLSDRAGVMISPKAFDNPNLDQQPVGAGMFKVTSFKPSDHITYERYEDYWDPDAVKVAKIEYLIQANSTTRLNAIRTGQVDWTFVDPVDADQAEDAGFELHTASTLSYFHLQLNRSFEPFADKWVRQAMNYAVDREALVEGLIHGYGEVAVQPYPKGYYAFNDEIGLDYYTYDPEKAKQLLAEAGYADGFKFDLLIPTITYYDSLAAAVQAQLQEIGIESTIKSVPSEQYADIFYVQLEGDGGTVPWGGRHDPSQTLGLLYSDQGFSNPGRHTTPEFMKAYEKTLEVQPEAKRTAAIHDATRIAVEEAFDVPLYNQYTPVVMADNVVGYQSFMSGKPEFRGIAIRK